MANTVFGYARVSTKEQNEGRQLSALKNFGIDDRHIFLDKQSGKDFSRPAYVKMIDQLECDDILVIKSIDRLGRNYDEILNQWRLLTKEKNIQIVVLDMPLLDTRKGRDLTGILIADIVLQLLSYVAETERAFIKQRQREGIELAQSRGVHFGRTAMEKPQNYSEVKQLWSSGEISARSAAKLLGVSHTCFNNWMREEKTKNVTKSTP